MYPAGFAGSWALPGKIFRHPAIFAEQDGQITPVFKK